MTAHDSAMTARHDPWAQAVGPQLLGSGAHSAQSAWHPCIKAARARACEGRAARHNPRWPIPGLWPRRSACALQSCVHLTAAPLHRLADPTACLPTAGTTCVSAETKLAMLRRKMEGGGRAALEDLRKQEQELLSVAQIEARARRHACMGAPQGAAFTPVHRASRCRGWLFDLWVV